MNWAVDWRLPATIGLLIASALTILVLYTGGFIILSSGGIAAR